MPAANLVADPAVRYEVLRDGARIAALKDLGLLDTPAEETFDRYTRLATNLLGVPVSLITLVDANRAFFKSQLDGDACRHGDSLGPSFPRGGFTTAVGS